MNRPLSAEETAAHIHRALALRAEALDLCRHILDVTQDADDDADGEAL